MPRVPKGVAVPSEKNENVPPLIVRPLGEVTTTRSLAGDVLNSQISDEPPEVVSEPSVTEPTAALPGARVAALSSVTAPESVPVPLSRVLAATDTVGDESGPLTRSSPPATVVAPA